MSARNVPGKNEKSVLMPKQYKIDKVAEIESSIEANAGVFMCVLQRSDR